MAGPVSRVVRDRADSADLRSAITPYISILINVRQTASLSFVRPGRKNSEPTYSTPACSKRNHGALFRFEDTTSFFRSSSSRNWIAKKTDG